ncbi:17494_t:CDS:2, partial [Dentiscutata erythropus]
NLGESSFRNTPMICKGQVKGWTVDIILDSGSSTKEINDKCNTCEDDYSRWETIKVLPTQEARHSQSLLVMGGADELKNNEHKELIQILIYKYPQAIAHDMTQLGQVNIVTHHIDTGNALPIRQHYYWMSPRHEAFIKEEIERLKQQKLI